VTGLLGTLLPEKAVAELAGCLLTSSTIERYRRCLERSEAVASLRKELRSTPDKPSDLVACAWSYWSRIIATPSRGEWEIPLAALLYVLGHTGAAQVDSLLVTCAVSPKSQATWISGLARSLLSSRSGATTCKVVSVSGLRALMKVGKNTRAVTEPRHTTTMPSAA